MKNINKTHQLEELNNQEMINIEGGWNLLEYVAMGIGDIHGKLDKAPTGDYQYSGFQAYESATRV
ncbi:hypothetical protein [Sphingobacterium sp. xlx-130]|uniref:hypothetical protein n=1 Tax=Sphingobacterium sp. xlx-130 TaxID=2654323 RepID=UPI0013DC61AC|nr:hypothetical protein [Sphingobacterium sp. xlx-130]